MKTVNDLLAAASRHPQNFFSSEKRRTLRIRFEGIPLLLKDGGALQTITRLDGTAHPGTEGSRIITIVRVYSDGRVEPTEHTVFATTDDARKTIHKMKARIDA